MRVALVFSYLGIFFVTLGFLINNIMLNNENKDLNERIVKLTKENNKLYEENDALWDNYYKFVKDYDGEYEYYE